MNDPGDQPSISRLTTGVPNLDAVLQGGLPTGAVTVLAGPPGSGKTILTQQICFHHAAQGGRILYFNTLTEPMAKTLRHLRPFAFFDPALLHERMRLVDLGVMLRSQGLALTCDLLMEHVRQFKPTLVVIDSFKVFDDLAQSAEELRKFTYELTVQLMAWECTSLLLGEYNTERFEHPAYSAIDGIVTLQQRALSGSGEQQRLLRVVKMRGTPHSRDAFTFAISHAGIELYALGLPPRRTAPHTPHARMKTGISQLDALLGEGIPCGAGVIVAGVPGTGKTVLGLEFIYRGAREQGQKGLYLSFEEPEERLHALARELGWALDEEVDQGRVRFVYIPQPDILVDRDIQELRRQVVALGAQRVVVDSMSVLLHKIDDPRVVRDKVFWLTDILHEQRAVGLFTNDIPPGTQQLTRSGVEETVMDGLIVLSRQEQGLERHRYIEVNKLRHTAHATGRHLMTIGPDGLDIFPRLDDLPPAATRPPPPASPRVRGSSGVAALDALLGGGLLENSVTLVSGSPGTGKSTLCVQFALDAARRQERALYITRDETPEQLLRDAEALDLPLRQARDSGWVRFLHLPRQHPHTSRLLRRVVDAIQDWKPSRVVLDSANVIDGTDPADEESRGALRGLLLCLRGLGVMSLMALESPALLSAEPLDEGSLAQLCDTLLLLRYARRGAELVPTLTVVKSRGSAHDRASHRIVFGPGGVTLAGRIQPESSSSMKKASAPRRRFFAWRRHD